MAPPPAPDVPGRPQSLPRPPDQPDPVVFSIVPSPLGPLLVVARGDTLIGLYLDGEDRAPSPDAHWRRDDQTLAGVGRQLADYFAGTRRDFDVAVEPTGTAFQRRVWDAMSQIPFGQTATYGELARDIGSPTAARAVGAACGANPVSIVVPCHRVVGRDGSLTGYAWGTERKRWLLAHEAAGTGGRDEGAGGHFSVPVAPRPSRPAPRAPRS